MAVALIKPETYVTDGKALFRIVYAFEDVLLLENCGKPAEPLVEMKAAELRRKHWRTVEPLQEAA